MENQLSTLSTLLIKTYPHVSKNGDKIKDIGQFSLEKTQVKLSCGKVVEKLLVNVKKMVNS